MYKRSFAIALLLSTCAHFHTTPALFTTPCGMVVHGYVDGGLPAEWTPAALADAEERTLAALDKYALDPRVVHGCGKLRNWHLYPMPTPTWIDPYGRSVAGVTNCSKDLSIAGAGEPRQWAVAHEICHALQRCNALLPVDDGGTYDHANWIRDGLFRAIDEAQTHGSAE